MIKYNVEKKEKTVYHFPVNKLNRLPRAGKAEQSLIFSTDGNTNIFINVERELKYAFMGNRHSEHYMLLNDALVLQYEYKNRAYSKFSQEGEMLIGHVFEEVKDEDIYGNKNFWN